MATTEEKLDTLLERTACFEEVAKNVSDHETVLYGPDKDDGLVVDMQMVKSAIKDMKNIFQPVFIAFILAIAGFMFGLLTHTITLGK